MKCQPRLVVVLALEGRPWIAVDADSHEDERRLWVWLDTTQALVQLAASLLALADEREQRDAA